MQTIYDWISSYGYAGLFLLLILGIVGLPVPDETLLAYVGYLVSRGHLRPVPTFVSAYLGSVCGISLSYGLGRTVGNYMTMKYGSIFHIAPSKIDQVHRWFDRAGRWALAFGYFVPGIRHLTAFVAGTSKLELSVFALFAYTGGLVWVLTFISLGYFFAEEWTRVSELTHRILLISIGIAALIASGYLLVRRHDRIHK